MMVLCLYLMLVAVAMKLSVSILSSRAIRNVSVVAAATACFSSGLFMGVA